MKRLLIVNADDFGLTRGVCEGILKAHQEGIVTGTTILMNSPILNLYAAQLKSSQQLSLGIHLNITWGKPLSNPLEVSSLLTSDGRFDKEKVLSQKEVNVEEAAREWTAQIQKARGLNLPIDHLDTHHHTHMHPALLDRIAEIAEKEKVAVRSQSGWVRDFLRANSIPTPDSYIGDFYGEGKTSREHLEMLLLAIPEGFTELCSHPGILDEELARISSYSEQRAEELATLTNPAWKTWLPQHDIRLASFKELPKPGMAPEQSCVIKDDAG